MDPNDCNIFCSTRSNIIIKYHTQPKHAEVHPPCPMFPEVFAYPVARQEMQMSSFFDVPQPPIRPHMQLKPSQRSPEHADMQLTHNGTLHNSETVFDSANFGNIHPGKIKPGSVSHGKSTSGKTAPGNTNHGTPDNGNVAFGNTCHVQRQTGSHIASDTIGTTNTHDMISRPPIILPPLRRVVKFTIEPHLVTIGISLCAFINTIVCIIIPSTITTPFGTQWGCFLYLWLLISIVQLVTHSVYLYTYTSRFVSLTHLTVVSLCAVLLPRSIFARCLWIAPCLCFVLVLYQGFIFCLLHTNTHGLWVYVLVGTLFVMGPMSLLIQTDSVDSNLLNTSTAWSAISIYALYAFAGTNSYKTMLVDVILGASPTSQLQE